ncbi:MAG: thiamine pyrophosphate-binding protein, partial [Chloroflexota bacterium]
AERTGRFAILEQFLADGIRFMFGNPGTVEQGFLDSLSSYPDVRYILTLQETIAVAVADGYARATQQPAVVQLHSGVGLGNGVGMLYQAMRGHAPLVVINGDAGVRYASMDAQMAADLVAIARPVTKWAGYAMDPGSVLRLVRRAIKIAATPPRGPVFLCLPMDVLDAINTEPVVPTSVPSTRVAPDPGELERAAAMLAGAKAPMIIMGDGVTASGAQRELVRVAEVLGAEVWGADSSEVNIPASHPQFRGLLGHMFGPHSKAITERADAVLIVGTYVFPEVFPVLEGAFAPSAKVVHVDLNAYEIAKNFPVDLGLVADPKVTLGQLAGLIEQRQSSAHKDEARGRAQRLAELKRGEAAAERQADDAAADALPMQPSRFMRELGARLPHDAIIFDEALTASPDVVRYMQPDVPGQYFQTRGGSLGVGVPGAIGAKLAHPDKTVVGFSGDGGSMYTIQALWTAAHHNIGAKFVICNNHSYKLLKLNVQQYWRDISAEEGEFPASFDLGQPGIRFDHMAEAMGVAAARVEQPSEIGPALDRALADDKPFLIEIVVSDDVPNHITHIKCGQ